MQNEKHVSLMGLIVGVAVAGAIAAFATMKVKERNGRTSLEKQLRMMVADLMDLRGRALFEKTPRAVRFTAGEFSIFPGSDTDDPPVLTKRLAHKITWGSGGDSAVVRFDTRGITGDAVSICIDDLEHSDATLDSLVVSETKIRTGKRDDGAPCNGMYIK